MKIGSGGAFVFFFQAEDGIREAQESRGLGDVYKRQGSVVDVYVNRPVAKGAGAGGPDLAGPERSLAGVTVGRVEEAARVGVASTRPPGRLNGRVDPRRPPAPMRMEPNARRSPSGVGAATWRSSPRW